MLSGGVILGAKRMLEKTKDRFFHLGLSGGGDGLNGHFVECKRPIGRSGFFLGAVETFSEVAEIVC